MVDLPGFIKTFTALKYNKWLTRKMTNAFFMYVEN